jgi:ascorbate-specific PTS system EIIC-type component UlaA
MVGAMGLARSTNLRSLLLTGWLVLIPASLMYVAILAVLA